jgi:hypothetical protein
MHHLKYILINKKKKTHENFIYYKITFCIALQLRLVRIGFVAATRVMFFSGFIDFMIELATGFFFISNQKLQI